MKQGFTAGAGIEVTMSLGEKTFEFLKPSYYAGMTREWETSEDGKLTKEEILAEIKDVQEVCRKVSEDHVDIDIYDLKQVHLFQEILKYKQKKGEK